MATKKTTAKKSTAKKTAPKKRKRAKTEAMKKRDAVAWTSADLQALGEKLLNPSWPRLQEVQDALEGITDPKEAWEILGTKELVPLAWIGDTKRVFTVVDTCKECGRDSGLPHRITCSLATTPPTLGAAITIAAAGEEVRKAEALTLEFVGRLGPWRTETPPSAIAWRVRCPPRIQYTARPGDEALAHLSGRQRHEADDRVVTAVQRKLAWKRYEPWKQEVYYASYLFAQDYNRMVRFAQRKDEERPNPFEPLLELWRTGFILEAVTEEFAVLLSYDVTQAPNQT